MRSSLRKGAKGSNSHDTPGAGFQALGKRSVAFQENQVLEKIRQSAGHQNDSKEPGGDGRSGELALERDLSTYDGQHHQASQTEKDRIDAQWQLNQYRERLVKEMERRDRHAKGGPQPASEPLRVSPIEEEMLSPLLASEPTTTSTESGNTIRGGMTPGFTARTPSYPFPRMAPTINQFSLQQPHSAISPNAEDARPQNSILSNPSTPASILTFLPHGYSQQLEQHDYPTPNLYDLTLMLSAEPGLDAWWSTVVQIMTECYKAERVTLSIPADSTDIENVPWGQKATYSAHPEDELSLGYMARGSSQVPSSMDDLSVAFSPAEDLLRPRTPSRPGLASRHSFTSYEDRKDRATPERTPTNLRRPVLSTRSKSSYPALPPKEDVKSTGLNKKALEEHDALEERQNIPTWEASFATPTNTRAKVLNLLQALDYEADPLIDHNGVTRVLESGRVIALTRNYPYLDESQNQYTESKSSGSGSSRTAETTKRLRKSRPEPTSNLSTLLSNAKASSGRLAKGQGKHAKPATSRFDEDDPRPVSPMYEEFEQAPPSPWSQSPAPSPAVRADPEENPFFTDAVVDEESFNPTAFTPNYSDMKPPEAIGVDNSWTVLHIPLSHVLLSKPNPGFRLDSTTLERRASALGNSQPAIVGNLNSQPSPGLGPLQKERQAPIAILSILSPIIPYPSNLRHSLEHLAPHLATSFSLCRHYSNLEIELSGLQKRRPSAAGFGAVGPDGRPLADASALPYLPTEDLVARISLAGSITSPSDYSAPARSTVNSPGGTPLWDPMALGFVMDKRTSASTSSPGPVGGDSYFTTKPKAGSSGQRTRRNSKDSDKRSSLRLSGGKSQLQESTPASPDSQGADEMTLRVSRDVTASSMQQRRPGPKNSQERSYRNAEDPSKTSAPDPAGHHRHTQLHSYGADFSSTFQSLPPSSTIGKGVPSAQPPSRGGSMSQADMNPPSDKLKSLILDSLPAHVFVALPQTGEIVWVNSRFLSYRGQNSGDLAADPWGSIHPDDRGEYLRAWSHSVRTGEQFSRTVRIKRFDGFYRWFYARAVASKDRRGIILQFLGSYMDIHDQHIAELRAARQEEIETSEAKHRLLANLIPQIIFTATEEDGITFSNEQWLSYTGQGDGEVLGLGFMDYVHPDDLAKCRFPLTADQPSTPLSKPEALTRPENSPSATNSAAVPSALNRQSGILPALSRNSSSGSSVYDPSSVNLTELAKKGIIKVDRDSSERLSYTMEIRLRSKSGEYRWHLVRCVEIDNIDFGSGASSYFGSATDINDLKLMETKLKEAMESKGRFLSNMSHEIRTPLIGISGMVSFLQDTILNEEQRDYTDTIRTSANNLLMIINDILDLSKVDAGMMKLNFEWFRIRSLIEDVNELVSTMAIAKRLELNYVVEQEVPLWIKGDKVRIRQILLNVIGNAIKFTSSGEVFSHCKVIVSEDSVLEESEIMLEFSVMDTGRGFTEDEAELIFKPFSQIDGSSTRQHGGSGLGLVISRQLAELHGGKMDGVAIPGEGSTFTFSAKFGLPTESERPKELSSSRDTSALKPIQEPPITLQQMQSKALPFRQTPVASPTVIDPDFVSPALASSGSSNPSVRSGRSRATERTSMSSVGTGLTRFSEAARASGQDLSQMKLEIPSERSSPGSTPTPYAEPPAGDVSSFRPPMYSILVVCPQKHSRWATTQHIEMTLPQDIPHQITALASAHEAERLVAGEDPVIFTHIVVNLPEVHEVMDLIRAIDQSGMGGLATVLIATDSVLKQSLLKQMSGTKDEKLNIRGRLAYIMKPMKTSRFAVIFDPAKEREQSMDHNRSTTQRMIEEQKQSYVVAQKRLGNKGYKVLLVEDNPLNQKVLQKYLGKVGVDVELAADGVECIEKVFSRPRGYYSVILCDLHMPRKDGYQACREIRDWEAKGNSKPMPIIALSANVMSDVQDKCAEAGFSDYITKPVDFVALSEAISKFF